MTLPFACGTPAFDNVVLLQFRSVPDDSLSALSWAAQAALGRGILPVPILRSGRVIDRARSPDTPAGPA